MDAALCIQVDGDLWFPEKGHADHATAALRICMRCPVRAQCRDLGTGEDFGIWGGVNRHRRHRNSRQAAA